VQIILNRGLSSQILFWMLRRAQDDKFQSVILKCVILSAAKHPEIQAAENGCRISETALTAVL
jgi:hypothetical protein